MRFVHDGYFLGSALRHPLSYKQFINSCGGLLPVRLKQYDPRKDAKHAEFRDKEIISSRPLRSWRDNEEVEAKSEAFSAAC